MCTTWRHACLQPRSDPVRVMQRLLCRCMRQRCTSAAHLHAKGIFHGWLVPALSRACRFGTFAVCREGAQTRRLSL